MNMSARQRNQLPPYEIMRQQAERPAVARPETGPRYSQRLREALTGWWPRADAPIVLHVPKGIAVAVLGGILGLILISYWVGHQRGITATDARYEIMSQQQVNLYRPREAPVQRPRSQTQQSTPLSQLSTTVGNRHRQQGMNHLILATETSERAKELIQFFQIYGVAAAAYPADTKGLVQVWDLRSFPGEEKGFKNWNEHKRKLQRIGRQWKQHNGNKGSDLSDMYYKLYQGN